MKRYLSYSLLMLSALLTLSCRDEDSIRVPQLQEAVNMRVVIDPEKSFINFQNLNTATFEFDVYSQNRNLQQVEFRGSYYDASEDATSDTVLVTTLSQADFSNGKARVALTPAQIAAAFNLPGGVGGLATEDQINLITFVTLSDGRTFSYQNAAASIVVNPNGSSFTTTFNTFVGCPSNIRTGAYTTVTTGTSTDSAPNPNPTVNFPGQVTITRLTPTSYQVSDVTGGLYFAWYGVYGAPNTLPGTLNDICGQFTLTAPGVFDETFTGTVTIDAQGVITYEWTNEFEDTGTTVFTPK
ncbi:MAG: hypothetical protein ICV83_07225 [Cytophagales bacterium]|nr:hypothetical protein [Cytophagales bacterium]